MSHCLSANGSISTLDGKWRDGIFRRKWDVFDGDSKATCVRIYTERYIRDVLLERVTCTWDVLTYGQLNVVHPHIHVSLRCQSMIFTTDLEAERDFSETSSPPRRKSPPGGTVNSVIIGNHGWNSHEYVLDIEIYRNEIYDISTWVCLYIKPVIYFYLCSYLLFRLWMVSLVW